jgi:trehalose synthase
MPNELAEGASPYRFDLPTVEGYQAYIGAEAVARIMAKAEWLHDLHVVNINSTYYGGGVAEMLSPLTLLMNSAGIKTGWRTVQGKPDFFSVTKKIHNALQGGGINLTDQKMRIFEEVAYENAQRLHLDHDVVVVHDPQPLPLIQHYRKKAPWIWRCHLDLSEPDPDMWRYIASFVESYDAVILSLPDYGRSIGPPQLFFAPAIDPFSLKNKELDEHEIDERIAHYGIPQDVPLVVQISRFDSWKDPKGVVEAAKIVMKETPCTLVLLGNVATDDPEGQTVFESIQQSANERIIVLSCQDTALVNALQRRAAVVVQKSLREGFGLTVTEAMWKGRPVVGGDAGGIRHQIDDGVNGFLVSSVQQAADRIMQLLRDPGLGRRLGEKARERVRQHFLMPRLMEQYLDLFAAFEARFQVRKT